MERSVCRTSLAAGILAQLSIIGRRKALLERLWCQTQARAWCREQNAAGRSTSPGPVAPGKESLTNCFLGHCGPAHLFAATMNVFRPRPDPQASALPLR